MTRFLKIFFGTLAVIFLLLLVLPIVFKGPIEKKVKDVINDQVNAVVTWDDFSISFIRHFPNLGIGLDGLSVINKAPFEGDTLVSVGRFSLAVDVMSAITGDAIDVKSVLIDQPFINLMVNADSLANWDIVPTTDEMVEEDTVSAGSTSFKVLLQSFEIREGRLAYADSTMNLSTTIDGFNLAMQGDLSSAYTTIHIQSTIDALNVKMDGIKYLSNSTVDLRANVGADLEAMKFTFEDNELVFNQLPLFFEGAFAMLDEGYDMDVKLSSKATEFSTLLAMVPDVFMTDLEGLKTKGTLAFEATAKGLFVDADHLPAFNVIFNVAGGYIQYPDLPKSIDNIGIDMVVSNPGGSPDNTVSEIKKFHFELDNSPFDASLKVITPVSNATFKGGMKGRIDLGALMDAVMLDSIEMKGLVAADLTIDGDYKTIEEEKYEDIKANGFIKLDGFEFRSPDLPMGVQIPEAGMQFTPRMVELSNMSVLLGESDFTLNGKLENYLGYALGNDVLKGSLSHSSKLIDSNELMGLSGEEEVVDTTTVSEPLETVMVPKNLDFVITTSIDRLLYDKLEMNNTKGQLIVKDGRVSLENLNTQMLQGSLVMNGQYNTQDTLKPFADFDLQVKSIDINKAANSFSMVDSLLPVAKMAKGNVSANLKFETLIGEGFSPVLKSMNGSGMLSSKSVKVEGTKVQSAMVSLLKNDKYSVADVKDLLVNFTIENGDVKVKPFDVNVFGKKVNIEGTQRLDQTMDYNMKMPVSRAELNSVASLLGGALPASTGDIMVGLKITGKVSDPKVKLNMDDTGSSVKSALKEAVGEKVEEQAEELLEKAAEEIKNNPELQEKAKEIGDKLKGLFD